MDITITGRICIPPWRNSYRFDIATEKEAKELLRQYREQTKKKDKTNGKNRGYEDQDP